VIGFLPGSVVALRLVAATTAALGGSAAGGSLATPVDMVQHGPLRGVRLCGRLRLRKIASVPWRDRSASRQRDGQTERDSQPYPFSWYHVFYRR
jgi:hypothetical protein